MQVQPPPVSLARLFLSWLRDSIRTRGPLGAAKAFWEQFGVFIRDSFPDRRKSRFGDIDYDCDYGVDTTWARLPMSVRLRELFTERLYQPTAPDEFHEVMARVPIDFRQFTFLDMGSGKGRVLLMASEYPFREIIGVEVQPELHAIAEQNILRFDAPQRKVQRITSLCMDARDYQFPDIPLLVYLFNPFPDYVMESVIANLRESIEQHPRPLYVIYNTPWEKKVLEKVDSLKKIHEDFRFQIYEAVNA